MNNRKRFVSSLAPAVVVAAALAAAGCGGGGGSDQGYTPPTPAPTPTPTPAESFTAWSKNGVFALPEDTTPIAMDTLVFNFDGDDNPNAYADLLPPT